MIQPDDVLEFWFPLDLATDLEGHRRQWMWWFGGAAEQAIVGRFRPTLEAAARGALDAWAATASGRLALVLVLDQFTRALYRGTPHAYANDRKAQRLVLAGLENGDYARLAYVWEKTFCVMPLHNSEDIALHERSLPLVEAMIPAAPAELRPLYERSLQRARGQREVVAQYGRHPQRNAELGRDSTPAELDYLTQNPAGEDPFFG
jgi:uncharacterized protein (DUF924 family)